MDLIQAIEAAGYAAPEKGIQWDGQLHRFATDLNKRHSKDGWYIAHDDAKGRAAAFGSWRDGASHTWSNGTGRKLTEAELKDIETKKRKALADEKRARDLAALRAQRIYADATADVAFSAYLDRKGIACPDGVRAVQGVSSKAFGFDSNEWMISGLIVPLHNKDGDLRSLQIIPDEEKRKKLFMRGGQTMACFFVIGDLTNATRILIGEGLATAQSAHQATGLPSVVAFWAHNLPEVAKIIRARHAAADIILLADDDEAGRSQSETAAALVKGRAVLTGDPACNDFNDLHQARGLDAVRDAILGPPPASGNPDIDWRAGLIIKWLQGGTQQIPCRVHNLILILTHAPEWAGRVRYNEFSARIAIDGKDLDDVGPVVVKAAIEHDWIPEKVPTSDIVDALSVVASRSPFHPVREYLNSLTWDGNDRITHFFEDHCGCPRDDYHIAVARSLFVSAVARVFKPGCKVDTMVILESDQGYGKTKLWLSLFGEWCSEVTASLSDKDFYAGLRGVWAADFSELDAFSRAEATQIKRILTSQSDSYRPHYGRTIQTFPRQCIFVGGTNRDDWQNDPTGARRFLPIRVKHHINTEAIFHARDQIWAEAVARFSAGETWWDIPDAKKHQDNSYQGDPWDEPVASYLMGKDQVSVSNILGEALRIETGKQTRGDQMRVSAILKRANWERKRTDKGWVYRRKKQ